MHLSPPIPSTNNSEFPKKYVAFMEATSKPRHKYKFRWDSFSRGRNIWYARGGGRGDRYATTENREIYIPYMYSTPMGWHCRNCTKMFSTVKTRMTWLLYAKGKHVKQFRHVNVTDRQTKLLYQYRIHGETKGIGVSLFARILTKCLNKNIKWIYDLNSIFLVNRLIIYIM